MNEKMTPEQAFSNIKAVLIRSDIKVGEAQAVLQSLAVLAEMVAGKPESETEAVG